MKSVSIRVDEDLYRQIKELADKERRPFSAQILYLAEKGIEYLDLLNGSEARKNILKNQGTK